MAVHRVTITEGLAFCEQVDHAKIAATTEADVQRYMREDGEEPDGDAEPDTYGVSAALVRTRTGLTQAPFADASDLSVKASRNWEQGRTRIEPAGVALLRLLAADLEGLLEKLSGAPKP